MRVSFKGPGAAAYEDMGGTFGNVLVSISYKKFPLKADQAGTEPIDHKVGGLEVKVTTTLAEIQSKTKWLTAFPHATRFSHEATGATISVGAPGVVTKAGHGFAIGDAVQFTAGTVPTGLSLNTTYYIVAVGFTSGLFSVALTPSGSAITTTGVAGSGVTITGVGNTNSAIDFYTNLGSGGQANSGELLLHPLSKDNSDYSTDYTFYKACAMAASEVTYGPENQLGLKVEWFIYPDMENGQRYMRYGDAALV
jgi:hypothetical protein